MNFEMAHENYNVSDLKASLDFYAEALDLHERCRKETAEITIVYYWLEIVPTRK